MIYKKIIKYVYLPNKNFSFLPFGSKHSKSIIYYRSKYNSSVCLNPYCEPCKNKNFAGGLYSHYSEMIYASNINLIHSTKILNNFNPYLEILPVYDMEYFNCIFMNCINYIISDSFIYFQERVPSGFIKKDSMFLFNFSGSRHPLGTLYKFDLFFLYKYKIHARQYCAKIE